ncbi:hypothetical protein [Luteimonas pelagia]
MTTPMTLDRFRALADAWGGDLSRWPVSDQAAAEVILATTPAARAVLDDARSLDALLGHDVVASLSTGLRRAIVLAADARLEAGFWKTLWRELGGARIAGPALAASVVLGVAASAMLSPALDATTTAEPPDYAELALLDGAYEDYAP